MKKIAFELNIDKRGTEKTGELTKIYELDDSLIFNDSCTYKLNTKELKSMRIISKIMKDEIKIQYNYDKCK